MFPESMPDQVTFFGESGCRISIEVTGYEREDTDNKDDANWLNATIAIEAGSFSGTFGVALTTHELIVLHDRLRAVLQSLSGNVVFRTTEEDLSLDFQFSRRGSVSISGVAQPHRSAAGSLHFRFESDQSCIGIAVRELAAVLRRFPVRPTA